MTSITKQNASLPKWARVVPPRFEKQLKSGMLSEPLSVAGEEAFLRTRSYHVLSRKIDYAVEASLATLSASFHEELRDLLTQVEPEESETMEPSPAKRARSEKETTEDSPVEDFLSATYRIDVCNRFNPLLLPMLVLQGPAHGLDRHDWMQHLVRSTKKKRPRSCTVWLHANWSLDFTWQEELTRQCLSQEPALSAVLRKRSFMAKASITDTLMEWAQSTLSFDDIVVFLEIEDDFYSNHLQTFIGWAATRRALQGIPFALVLLGPHTGRRPLELRSYAQGPVGVLLRHLTLPSTAAVVDLFFERLWIKQDFPILFSAPIREHLGRVYREQNESAICVAMKLKLALAHIFCAKWSFLLAASCLPDERYRIKWFLIQQEPRKLIPGNSVTRASLQEWMDSFESKARCGRVALRILCSLLGNNRDTRFPLLFQLGNPQHGDTKPFESNEKTNVLSLLFSIRDQIDHGSGPENATVHLSVAEAVNAVNRLIVLSDKCETFSDMHRCAGRYAHEWVDLAFSWPGISVGSSSALASLDSQPRRHSVRGLLEAPSELSQSTNLVKLVGNMYRLIQDRVGIDRSEWFKLFRHTFALELNLNEALKHFGYGVYHLMLCGLLRERRLSHKNDIRYEKTLLVWCSGD